MLTVFQNLRWSNEKMTLIFERAEQHSWQFFLLIFVPGYTYSFKYWDNNIDSENNEDLEYMKG